MSGQSIALNSVPNEPTLSDLLDLLKKEIMLGLNCHHVGTVQSFSAATMTVTASINYTKTFFQLNPASQTYLPVQVNYAPVLKAPIICLGGGKANLTMPIAAGDECLLIFNDRDIDNWFSGGTTTQANATGRLHAFTDAFCLVGVKSIPNVLAAYDTVRALITNGNASIGINPSNNKVTIKNTAVGTLNATLQNILTQLGNLCTQIELITVTVPGVQSGSSVATSAVPTNAAAIAAISTQISTYATQLGNLLE